VDFALCHMSAFGSLKGLAFDAQKDLHTVFCAECTTYFDWKSAGMFYTHRTSGMPGPITRLLACSDEQRRVYPKRGMEMGPTFVHPNYANPNPHNGESSGSYNKPAAVMHWTREAQIRERFVLFVDADMLLRAPIDPVALGVRSGVVVSEHVGYLEQGIRHGLVQNFIPQSQVHLARAAGWYHIFALDDLTKIAPRWLHYTEKMRTSPQLYWNMNGSIPKNIPTGDDYVKFGEAPWISEMYGYMFAAAEQGIDTKLQHGIVQYADSPNAAMPSAGPHIIHYGLHCHVNDYHFTKYDYGDFDINLCGRHFFRAPETPRANQALCAETVYLLNDALCDFYSRQCPADTKRPLKCPPHADNRPEPPCINTKEDCAARVAAPRSCEVAAIAAACPQSCTQCCGDADPRCRGWAMGGECDKNAPFMQASCKASCQLCAPPQNWVDAAEAVGHHQGPSGHQGSSGNHGSLGQQGPSGNQGALGHKDKGPSLGGRGALAEDGAHVREDGAHIREEGGAHIREEGGVPTTSVAGSAVGHAGARPRKGLRALRTSKWRRRVRGAAAEDEDEDEAAASAVDPDAAIKRHRGQSGNQEDETAAAARASRRRRRAAKVAAAKELSETEQEAVWEEDATASVRAGDLASSSQLRYALLLLWGSACFSFCLLIRRRRRMPAPRVSSIAG